MISFILHTHLPYVLNHGTWPHGSDWLSEAVAECYLPLLRMCNRLRDEGIRPAITFDISPVLCEQLSHPEFAVVFERYCAEHADLARIDEESFRAEGNDAFADLASTWATWYEERWEEFDAEFGRDIVGALKKLQDDGSIEVMTCGLTHGYLPLLAEDESIERQVGMAVSNYQRHFGRRPRGIWLPECAYRPGYPWRSYLLVEPYTTARDRPGIEHFLHEHDLEYFVTDQDHLESAQPIGVKRQGSFTAFSETVGHERAQLNERSVFDLFRVGSNGTDATAIAFARHRDICMQVWSGDTGYPGDADYMDFHKKYFRSSLRYWRVTDNKADMQYKQAYVPEWAETRAREHADHFVRILAGATQHRQTQTGRTPTVCLPFDTELFGHWWFEGPLFLEHVLRGIDASPVMHASTASENVDEHEPTCVVSLPESSWGKNGHHDVWMNHDVQWTWEKEYRLEQRFKQVVQRLAVASWDETLQKIMVNAMRQLLLAQASDWQFLITTWSSREYAEMRFHNHAADTAKLLDLAERYVKDPTLAKADQDLVDECEKRDEVFSSEIQAYYASRRGKAAS
jgi:1,4-alpha-glucan branching enzyme